MFRSDRCVALEANQFHHSLLDELNSERELARFLTRGGGQGKDVASSRRETSQGGRGREGG